MRKRHFSFCPDEIEMVMDQMRKWADKPSSMTIPQFLHEHRMGYSYFYSLVYATPRSQDAFESIQSQLCRKWIDYAFQSDEGKNLNSYQAKILMKYVNLYDLHARDVRASEKAVLAEVEALAATQNYAADDYSNYPLEGIHKENYERNINKRRSHS